MENSQSRHSPCSVQSCLFLRNVTDIVDRSFSYIVDGRDLIFNKARYLGDMTAYTPTEIYVTAPASCPGMMRDSRSPLHDRFHFRSQNAQNFSLTVDPFCQLKYSNDLQIDVLARSISINNQVLRA